MIGADKYDRQTEKGNLLERTLIIVKPDAVQRGLTGEIIKRFEQRGLKIIGMKLLQMSRELAEKHYDVHRERPFFAGLVEYIISAPVVVMALEGSDAIIAARTTIGATKPFDRGGDRKSYGNPAPSAATTPWRSGATWCMAPTVWRTARLRSPTFSRESELCGGVE